MGNGSGDTSSFIAKKIKCAVWDAANMFFYIWREKYFDKSWSL
jgi:hypothetical protein